MKLIFNRIIVLYRSSFSSKKIKRWGFLLSLTFLASYFYAFLEWLFYISQPSYASISSNLLINISVFLFSGFTLAAFTTILYLILLFFYYLCPIPIIQKVLLALGQSILALVIACLFLLLVDNFTYTIFKIGIITSSGIFRVYYMVLFIGLFIISYRWSYNHVKTQLVRRSSRILWQFCICVVFLSFSVGASLTNQLSTPTLPSNTAGKFTNTTDLPNILIIGSDGVDANRMSVYGYERDTTPNILAFSRGALVAENAFHNSNNSYGSVTSMLTGKLPTTTRVLYPPDILLGEDAYQHLPGILKANGYRTVQIATPHYIDSFNANFREGFDIVNNRTINNYPLLYAGWKFGGDYPYYFVNVTIDRIAFRLLHIFFIRQIQNPYKEVTTGITGMMTDRERVDSVLALLNSSDQPLFLHLHLMGTHGPNYTPTLNYFASSQTQNETNAEDFYDDAIRDYDNYFGEIITQLNNSGLIDRTIVVVYSDHGKNRTTQKVPWLIRFPGNDFSGHISANVQNLDIAPTLLDYLNIQIPDWMEGKTILEPFPENRRIYLSEVFADKFSGSTFWLEVNPEKIGPPFYQFEMLQMIVCDQYYKVVLNSNLWTTGSFDGHTNSCGMTEPLPLAIARNEMIDLLRQSSFDVASIIE